MYFVYILKSLKNGKYYIGSTHNLDKRLKEHNEGKTKSIRAYIPYEIVYKETFTSNTEARKRENYIKKRKSRKFIEELIKSC